MKTTRWAIRRGLWVAGCMVLLSQSLVAAPPQAGKAWEIGTPIVTYWAGPAMSDATAAQMAEGGWNLVWCSDKELDVAQRHSLRGMLFMPELLSPAALDDPAKRSQLDELIERVRRHPAMYCYFITDEPSAKAFPAFGKLLAYLRERDPTHMAYINLFPTYANNEQLGTTGDQVTAYREHLRQFVDVVQPKLLSYDHYQFATHGDIDGYFLNLSMIRQSAQDAGIPFLNIVQACSWDPARRVPTGNEMRYLLYTSLAYGAQGISYYVYCCQGHVGGIARADGTPTELYQALSPLNREFVAVATQLQPLQSQAIYHLGMLPLGAVSAPADLPFQLTPAVEPMEYQPPEPVRGVLLGLFGTTKDPAQATHVLVVNLDYKQALKTTLVGPMPLQPFDATAGRWLGAAGDRMPLELPPGGGKLVRCVPQ
jgi:hypothetical protein